jgi:transcriptional regulator of acetoin/glycerol metabolism
VDLATVVASGSFREDLAHRVASAVIRMPALRERMQDMPALVAGILVQLDPTGALTFTSAALRPLLLHRWPGNVRELRNVLERAAAFTVSRVIDRDDTQRALENGRARDEPAALRSEFTQRRILEVLHETGWNISAAARVLGVHRATLYRRMRRMGLADAVRVLEMPDAPRSVESTA